MALTMTVKAIAALPKGRITPERGIAQEEFLQVVRTNVAGPAVVSQVCLPFLEKGEKKVIVHITSTDDSLQSVSRVGAGYTSYCMSKAALNMLALKQKSERSDLRHYYHFVPGTDMDPNNDLDPVESVVGILEVLSSLSTEDSGKFLSDDGSVIPW
ncbi:hypothetical protein PYCCODRAFT_1469208 [Trametes coccinea BRFM310]|uniref:NAD(P)-binding protein n=1 Tax=Trametes coccinea (strain BRFM310) TaxID=1353009 RepID=A0A1Y2II25_TRAC3|nr:hypothetical protein PYCCODRAFT_1469208 [Trametes coccinea BRFM310]